MFAVIFAAPGLCVEVIRVDDRMDALHFAEKALIASAR